MNIIIAIILAIGAGISRLYITGHINILFWIGSVIIVFLLIIFAIIAKTLHKYRKTKGSLMEFATITMITLAILFIATLLYTTKQLISL